MSVVIIIVVTAAVTTFNILVLRFWWRAAIAKPRSFVVFLLVLPMLAATTLGSLFTIGTAAAWVFAERQQLHSWFIFVCMMFCLLPTGVVSFRYSQKYVRTHPKASF